ncbi:MAG: hypothetical protein E7660_06525 [Ruminococcaceae bacterium]|nr:hypothetical protein [Oscillospiraceae bacterium]
MKRFLKCVSLVLCILFALSPIGLFAGVEDLSALDFKSEAESALIVPTEGKVVPGDIDGDGAFAVRDSLLLKKHLLGIAKNIVVGATDVNCDGDSNAKDVLCLKKHLAGMVGCEINTASASVVYADNMKAARVTAKYEMPAVSISSGAEVSSEDYPFAVFSYILPETENSEVTLRFGSFAVKLDLIADGVSHSMTVNLSGAETFDTVRAEMNLDKGESFYIDSLIFAATKKAASAVVSEREKGAVPAVRHEIIFDSAKSLDCLTAINNTDAVYSETENALALTVTGGDPQSPVDYTDLGVSADECKYIIFTYMVPSNVSSSATETEMFLCAGDIKVPTANYSIKFTPVKDGAYHSLIIPLTEVAYWQGDIYMIRVDYFSNCQKGDAMYVDSLCLASTKAEATAVAKERMAERGISGASTVFDGKIKINGTDSAVKFYDASSVSADGTYTFAGQMTAVISSKEQLFNRFRFEYSTNTIVRGIAYYMVDGVEKADEFFLENTSGKTMEFTSLILGYFDGKYASRITMIEFYTIKTASASVKISAITGEKFEEFEQGTYFLENEEYKLGVDLLMGGGVNYLEYFKDGNASYGNLLNNYDVGRLIQQSYYGIDKEPYPMGYWTDRAWGYNPVQGGDKLNNISRIIDFEFISDTQFYVKARPMDWGQVNMATPSYMENIYTLTEDYVHVYNRFVDFSIYTHTVGWQELPAFYTISALNNFTYYNGDRPWTNDTLINRDDLIFWGQTSSQAFELKSTSEFWSAWVDNSGFGVGLYVPGVYTYHAGKFMYDGSADPAAASTNYVAPRRYLTLISGKPLEYSYIFSAGTLTEIRENFRVNRDLVDNTALENYNN